MNLMELELGLSLIPLNLPIKNLDLNINSFKPKHQKTTLKGGQCDLGLDYFLKNYNDKKKRSFVEAFDEDDYECVNKKPPNLLVWNGQPIDGGDERNRRFFDSVVAENNIEEEENQIIGWPPVKSWRKKLLQPAFNQIKGCGVGIRGNNNINAAKAKMRGNINNGGGVLRNGSIYVKVKMEGVAIGRKIDLMLFNSYQDLIATLIKMFSRYKENDKEEEEPYNYILSYLDKEGDWLLAGDVPWKIFVETVQRMEISKQSS